MVSSVPLSLGITTEDQAWVFTTTWALWLVAGEAAKASRLPTGCRVTGPSVRQCTPARWGLSTSRCAHDTPHPFLRLPGRGGRDSGTGTSRAVVVGRLVREAAGRARRLAQGRGLSGYQGGFLEEAAILYSGRRGRNRSSSGEREN